MKTLTCVRPIQTGSLVWSRKARDADRKVDSVRCMCGGENCRDTEVKDDEE